jgi:hypothetical protein
VKDNNLDFVGFQETKKKISMNLFCLTSIRILTGRFFLPRGLLVAF